MTKQDPNLDLWGRNRPLIFYGNQEKLNTLLFRAYGHVVTQTAQSHTQSGKASMGLSGKLGGLLSFFGLGEASAEASTEIGSERAKSVVYELPFEAKLDALMRYARGNEPCPYIDAYSGTILEGRTDTPLKERKGRPISQADRIDQLGFLLSLYRPTRLHPPDASASIVDDFMNQANALWMFESIPQSKVRAEVPILACNARLQSQHGLVAFLRSVTGNFKIETFGLCTWSHDRVTCDPVGWRLFY